jgi:hypothetical protein
MVGGEYGLVQPILSLKERRGCPRKHQSNRERDVSSFVSWDYEVVLPSEDSDVRRVVVDARELDIRVEFQGASKVPFFSGGECTRGAAGLISCSAECDGGSVLMSRAGNGLSLKAQQFALVANVESGLPSPQGADRGTFSGSFNLKKVDARVCETAFNSRSTDVGDLQRGDFSPKVRRVGKYLSDLGFLAQKPDWYFDGSMENSVRAIRDRPDCR